MNVRIRSKVLLAFSMNLFLLIVEVSFMIAFLNGGIDYLSWSYPATVFSFISILFNAIAIKVYKIDILDFRFMFMALLYLFMYGRIWLNCFGMDKDIFWVLHTYYKADVMLQSSMYCVCCIQAIFLGLLCVKERREIPNKDVAGLGKININTVGIILLLIAGPCRIYLDMRAISETLSTGSYLAITGLTGIIDDLVVLFIPGVLCLMEGKPKKRRTIFFVVVIYFFVVMSLTGDRRYYVTSIIALGAYLLYVEGKKHAKKKNRTWKVILICVAGIVFLSFLEVMRKIRATELSGFTSFLKNYGSDIFVIDDLLFDVLAEFGISFFSVVNLIDNIPSIIGFQYGMTLVRTIPSVLPIGFMFGGFFDMATPSTVINIMTGRGLGSTLFGDLYANFGCFGVLFCFFAGVVLSRVVNPNKREQNSMSLVMYYSLYSIMINLVRCTIFEVYRASIWMIVIVYIIYIGEKRRNRCSVKSNGSVKM